MKITISKSQWEEMGRKAGWSNPNLKNLPPMGEVTGNSDHDDPIFDKEWEIRDQEAERLFQQLLKAITPTVNLLAKRFYNTGRGEADKQWIDEMRYEVLYLIGRKIEQMTQGKV